MTLQFWIEATPLKADCYDCDEKWSGAASRKSAREHREDTGHAVWIVCAPEGANPPGGRLEDVFP